MIANFKEGAMKGKKVHHSHKVSMTHKIGTLAQSVRKHLAMLDKLKGSSLKMLAQRQSRMLSRHMAQEMRNWAGAMQKHLAMLEYAEKF